MKGRCTQSANGVKVVIRHVWEDHKEAVDAHRLTDTGKRLYRRRKETVERSFADAKELHGHRYARFRGLTKVRAQALPAGACQNMKKLARAAERLLTSGKPSGRLSGSFSAVGLRRQANSCSARRLAALELKPPKQNPVFGKKTGFVSSLCGPFRGR